MAILIVDNYKDPSVDKVIDWILLNKKKAIRSTFEDLLDIFFISCYLFNDETIQLNLCHKRSGEFIESAWFRSETDNNFHSKFLNHIYNLETDEVQKYLRYEVIAAKQIIINGKYLRWLSDYSAARISKFNTLVAAKQIGLKVPDSIITNNKQDVINFFYKYHNSTLITKSIGENLRLTSTNRKSILQPVKELTYGILQSLPDTFMPSLFQLKIEKDYDIRIFYLNGKCYPMSIHTDKLDFRDGYKEAMYNPIVLPEIITEKIRELMLSLELNIGNIDIIKEKKTDNYYFLEINPNGQFGFVSSYCNYNLEKEIANYLCYEN